MDYGKNRGIYLLSLLAEAGIKVFKTSQAKELAKQAGLKESAISQVLVRLKKQGWIIPLRNGLFALAKGFSLEPLHEFEIAMALADPVAISHWSALSYHGLSDQIPIKVFLLTTNKTSIPRQKQEKFGTCNINGITYVFTTTKQEHFFGLTRIWINRMQVCITDPERTLLDALDKPQLCGGFDEVVHCFKERKDNLDLDKIITYALKLDIAIIKRLGWVLSSIGYPMKSLSKLKKIKIKGTRKLDCSGPNKGRLNSTWMVMENIYG